MPAYFASKECFRVGDEWLMGEEPEPEPLPWNDPGFGEASPTYGSQDLIDPFNILSPSQVGVEETYADFEFVLADPDPKGPFSLLASDPEEGRMYMYISGFTAVEGVTITGFKWRLRMSVPSYEALDNDGFQMLFMISNDGGPAELAGRDITVHQGDSGLLSLNTSAGVNTPYLDADSDLEGGVFDFTVTLTLAEPIPWDAEGSGAGAVIQTIIPSGAQFRNVWQGWTQEA